MFRVFTFYVTTNSFFKNRRCSKSRVNQDVSLNIGENSFHRIKPRTICRKLHQSNRLTLDISPEHLRTVSSPAVQNNIKTITPIMFPQEFKTSDNFFCRFSNVKTHIDLFAVDIIGCQKFTFTSDILFGRHTRSLFAPRTSSIAFNNQRAFFIKRKYSCFTWTFIQKLFNAFFSLQNEDLDLPSISERILMSIHLCIDKFSRFLYRCNPLSCALSNNPLIWGGSRW